MTLIGVIIHSLMSQYTSVLIGLFLLLRTDQTLFCFDKLELEKTVSSKQKHPLFEC